MFSDIGSLIQKYWDFYLKGTVSTLILAIVGTAGGLMIGIFLGIGKNLGYKSWWKGTITTICSAYSTVIRGTPMMVQALLFKYGCQMLGVNWNSILPGLDVFNGWLFAGLVVITLNNAAYMCEIVRSGLNGVDSGQNEGARALGLSYFQSLFLVVLPQALRNAIPTIGSELIVNIKDSSVLNVIGVTELYYQSIMVATVGYKYMATYILVAIIYLILTLTTNLVFKIIEYRLDGKKFKMSFFHYNGKTSNVE